ncbi:hypothetical protein BDV11DRAFT_182619 [Aspergillus similis]
MRRHRVLILQTYRLPLLAMSISLGVDFHSRSSTERQKRTDYRLSVSRALWLAEHTPIPTSSTDSKKISAGPEWRMLLTAIHLILQHAAAIAQFSLPSLLGQP